MHTTKNILFPFFSYKSVIPLLPVVAEFCSENTSLRLVRMASAPGIVPGWFKSHHFKKEKAALEHWEKEMHESIPGFQFDFAECLPGGLPVPADKKYDLVIAAADDFAEICSARQHTPARLQLADQNCTLVLMLAPLGQARSRKVMIPVLPGSRDLVGFVKTIEKSYRTSHLVQFKKDEGAFSGFKDLLDMYQTFRNTLLAQVEYSIAYGNFNIRSVLNYAGKNKAALLLLHSADVESKVLSHDAPARRKGVEAHFPFIMGKASTPLQQQV
jgi:hypothetical protein